MTRYHEDHCGYCCYGSDLGSDEYHDSIVHYHPDCPLHGHLAMELPGIEAVSSRLKYQENALINKPISLDPAHDWDEDDGYEYDDTKPELGDDTDGITTLNRPDYIGIVSGAEYKLDAAESVSMYALAIAGGGEVLLFEVGEGDLECLARQIDGLLKR